MHKILNAIIIPCIFLILPYNAYAQLKPVSKLKKWEIKGYALSAEIQRDLHSATYFYKHLSTKYPKNKKYLWKLALNNYKFRNYEEAYKIFNKLLNTSNYNNIKTRLYLAKTCKNLNKYEEAISLLKPLKKDLRKTKKYINILNNINNELIGCQLAISMRDSSYAYNINLLDEKINHKHIEFNPFYLNDTSLIFSSTLLDSIIYFDTLEIKPRRKFYKSSKLNNQWSKPTEFNNPYINSNEYDTGDGTYSLDGKRFYFTICKPNWQKKTICQLYYTEKENNHWSTPIKINSGVNIDDFSSTEPTVGNCYSPELEVLYFISDRPEGQGGKDIWFTIYNKKTKEFQKPLNAGLYINTPNDEATPFYDKYNHRLYFSSDGWPGIGGFDIFYSYGDMVNWEEPINLGIPLNSSFDDLYYNENKQGNKGFITSNRSNKFSLFHKNCCDDIYAWETTSIKKVSIKGKIWGSKFDINSLTNNNLIAKNSVLDTMMFEDTNIDLYVKNDSTNLIFIENQNINKEGSFEFMVPKGLNYVLIINDNRVLDNKISFNTIDTNPMVSNIDLKPTIVETISKEPIVLNNIYYKFNDTELTDDSKSYLKNTLVKFLKKYKNVNIEIRSHTDNIGTPQFNLTLSKRRSHNVINYLISQQISRNRLVGIGLGDTNPIAPNSKPDGSDNHEGRAMNRRTEFKISNQKN